MPPCSLIRGIVALGLMALSWVPAWAAPVRAVRGWLSDLVTRIDTVDRADRRARAGRRAGTAMVRVEIAADGSVRRAAIERSSGSRVLDRRALRAVRGVSPVAAPPAALLAGAGVVDLSIPVRLAR